MARWVLLPLTWKTRVALPPLTVSWLAFRPSIVRSSVTLSSPPALLRVMVPFNPLANWMTSAPGWVLAAVIAARSDPGPLSARLVTVKVLSRVRSSRARGPAGCGSPDDVSGNRFDCAASRETT
jgi:hypothetical protein